MKNAGFTLVEVLIAIALFAIVVLVVLAPLTGLFGLSQKSAQQTTATNLVQQTVEQIRGQWLNANRYGNNCVAGPLPSSAGTPAVSPVVTVQDEDAQGNDTANAVAFSGTGDSTSCSTVAPATGAPAGPPLREVTVTGTVNGVQSKIVVEVARP
ncbi:type IV pilus modification PilV family protein [Deinococcus sp. UYEF24]